MTTATLRAVGNSVAVVIPKQWLSLLGLEAGAKVELILEAGHLTLKPQPRPARKRYSLAELLADCDPEAPLPDEMREWDETPATGREVW